MKNDYEIRGDITAIFITSPKHGKLETIIDTSDLEKVKAFPNTWLAQYDITVKSFYINGRAEQEDGKRKLYSIHRLVTDAPKGMLVDHINHDTLDNRKSVNLRLATNSENQQNKTKSRSDNISGVLGVSWYKRYGNWKSGIRIDGRSKHLGYFSDIADAENAVREARKKYFPFSQESL